MDYDTIPRKGIKLPGTLTTETRRMKILKLLLIIQFKGGRTLYIELLHLLNSSLYKTVAHGTVGPNFSRSSFHPAGFFD